MIKLRPLSNRVIVKQHDVQELSEGGIALVGVEDKPLMGTVLEVGPGYWLDAKFVETTVKPGDVVLFGNTAGVEVEVEHDVKVLMLFENEILATLDE